jgi:hypothetical protein
MVPRLDGLCFNLLFLFFSTALLKSYFSGPRAEIITRRRAKFDDFYFVFAPRRYRGISSLRFSYHVFLFFSFLLFSRGTFYKMMHLVLERDGSNTELAAGYNDSLLRRITPAYV